jgi:hypothetical protein
MGTFEYITALVAVVIGLAIADLATSLHRLLRYRKMVRWDWVAPLAALLVLVELFNLWWRWRGFTGTTMGAVVPYFVALILIYLAASIALPDEVPEGGLDLGAYFDEVRNYFWFVYTTYVAVILTLVTVRRIGQGYSASQIWAIDYLDFPLIILGYSMIFVRKRWISGAVLFVTLMWLLWGLDIWDRAPDAPL